MNKRRLIGIILCIVGSWFIEFALMQSVIEVVRLNIFFLFIAIFGGIVCAILYHFGWLQAAFADFGKLEIDNDKHQ
jgi:uncharacterized membrane protein YeaQ/YmgE (transglycosylase-associated protein family)